ncbi:4-hydroxybenzoate transporter PcaK [Moraxella ovis]|uniref:4-hydroxybenzoate transporter PcaK n=1 Tax=Moraxella ovis TaxID=29433 RepID=A0A378PK84_9GAMM|nr:MFS transporter [Moraxella ovis]STY86530.1 4-hydroxybenzoate transporter PcaK [Moraxella ovis]
MTHTQHTSNLAHAINHTPMSAYQWLIVALAVILNMLDGFDVLAIAFTAKNIQTELGLTGAEIGTLMSAGFIGMAIGSMGLAPLADKFDRCPLLIIATALSAVGVLMTYFSHSVETIGFWRVITGRYFAMHQRHRERIRQPKMAWACHCYLCVWFWGGCNAWRIVGGHAPG